MFPFIVAMVLLILGLSFAGAKITAGNKHIESTSLGKDLGESRVMLEHSSLLDLKWSGSQGTMETESPFLWLTFLSHAEKNAQSICGSSMDFTLKRGEKEIRIRGAHQIKRESVLESLKLLDGFFGWCQQNLNRWQELKYSRIFFREPAAGFMGLLSPETRAEIAKEFYSHFSSKLSGAALTELEIVSAPYLGEFRHLLEFPKVMQVRQPFFQLYLEQIKPMLDQRFVSTIVFFLLGQSGVRVLETLRILPAKRGWYDPAHLLKISFFLSEAHARETLRLLTPVLTPQILKDLEKYNDLEAVQEFLLANQRLLLDHKGTLSISESDGSVSES